MGGSYLFACKVEVVDAFGSKILSLWLQRASSCSGERCDDAVTVAIDRLTAAFGTVCIDMGALFEHGRPLWAKEKTRLGRVFFLFYPKFRISHGENKTAKYDWL